MDAVKKNDQITYSIIFLIILGNSAFGAIMSIVILLKLIMKNKVSKVNKKNMKILMVVELLRLIMSIIPHGDYSFYVVYFEMTLDLIRVVFRALILKKMYLLVFTDNNLERNNLETQLALSFTFVLLLDMFGFLLKLMFFINTISPIKIIAIIIAVIINPIVNILLTFAIILFKITAIYPFYLVNQNEKS